MRGALSCLALIIVPAGIATAADVPRGKLLIVGGGPIDDGLRREIVKRGGSRMVIVPFASDLVVQANVVDDKWLAAGARQVYRVSANNLQEAKKWLSTADFIWAPGGKQTLLARRLRELKLDGVIRQRYREGATFGGTSAGASIVSRHMIRSYQGKTDLLEGLGLWPEVVVDQHFLKRNRDGRLSTVIREHPQLLGVGLDESTAIEVQGRHFEVFGSSKVVVLDGRRSLNPSGGTPSLRRLVLPAGKRFDLDRGLLAD